MSQVEPEVDDLSTPTNTQDDDEPEMKDLPVLVIGSPDMLYYSLVKFKGTGTESLILLDSGAAANVMPIAIYQQLPAEIKNTLQPTAARLSTVTLEPIQCHGRIDLVFDIEQTSFKARFFVTNDDSPLILGYPFLHARGWALDSVIMKVRFDGKWFSIFNYDDTRACKVSANKTTHIRPGEQKLIQATVLGNTDVARPSTLSPSVQTLLKTNIMICKVIVTPCARQVPVRIINTTEETLTLFKKQHLGLLYPVEQTMQWKKDEVTDEDCADYEGPKPVMNVAVSDSDGQADPTHDNLTTTPQLKVDENMSEQEFYDNVQEHMRELLKSSIEGLTYSESRKVRALFMEYPDIFAKHKQDFGQTKLAKHPINTGDEPPVKQRPRRIPRAYAPEVQKQVKDMAEKGIIRPSTSSWASNVLLVKKKDGTFRMCIDYRELNAKTKDLDEYILPRIDDTLDALSLSRFFCCLDLIQGYHQVELEPEDKHKTAFLAPQCVPTQWEFNYMPFGLTGAPRTFQKMMDILLRGLEFEIALAYLDDIIVFAPTFEKCLANVRVVFDRIREAGLKLKPAKCTFFRPETLFLGHIISGDGIRCDPAKTEAISKWEPPKNVKQVRSFLGMTNYYRKFIQNYAHKSEALHGLLRKGKKFRWEQEEQKAFADLKASLTSPPVMAFPRDEGQFILDTDASAYAIGGVLSQMQKNDDGEWEERVIAYASRRLSDREQRYCARRRELLAIVEMVKHFHTYLRGPRFVIRTDHASLRYVKTLKEMPDQFARWIMYLESFNYEIQVRKGALHINADALSRYMCEGKQCICAGTEHLESECDGEVDQNNPLEREQEEERLKKVMAIQFTSLWSDEEMIAAQKADPDIGIVYDCIANGKPRPSSNEIAPYSAATKAYYLEWKRLELHRGLLYRRWENDHGDEYKLQLILPHKYQILMCQQFHDGRRGAHLGRRRVVELIQRHTYWYKMTECVRTWIKTCPKCQQNSRPGKTPKAPMQKYIVGYCNERVCMDICGPLTISRTKNLYVLVITDSFSKYTKAFPMKNGLAMTVAELFTQHWINDFGEPEEIHTDQGGNFESNLMAEVCEMHSIHKTRTSTYHPKSNGQVERFNQTMMKMIRAMDGVYEDWDEKLGMVVSAYNATVHATTGFTPNRLWFGREMSHSADAILPENPTKKKMTRDMYVRLLERDNHIAYEIARQITGRSVVNQKKYHDRCSHLNKYKVGDMVLLKELAQAEAGMAKLRPKWDGPYYIIDIISDVDFRIAKSPTSRRTINHHDRLRPYYFRPEDKHKYDNSWVFEISRSFHRKNTTETIAQTEDISLSDMPSLKRLGVDHSTQTEDVDATGAAYFRTSINSRRRKRTQPYNAVDPLLPDKPKRPRGRPRKIVVEDMLASRIPPPPPDPPPDSEKVKSKESKKPKARKKRARLVSRLFITCN